MLDKKLWLKDKLGFVEDYDKPLPIIELYTAIQSEGSRQGMPTVVVRTTGCTHRCFFGEGGWCDSWYTSIHPEKGSYTLNDVMDLYEANPHIKEMMITGGSPSMHGDIVNTLNKFAKKNNITTTIETEGSHFLQTEEPLDLISLSPKFHNSVPVLGTFTPKNVKVEHKLIDQHNKFRLNKEAIRMSLDYHNDYHFKPVCNPKEDPSTWNEIEAFRKEMNIPKNKTWVMCPGDNRHELIRVYPQVMEFCMENGYNFAGRAHIIAYDDQRAV